MHHLCQEVINFVSACEVIQANLAQGGTLTPDEMSIIEDPAIELLSRLRRAE